MEIREKGVTSRLDVKAKRRSLSPHRGPLHHHEGCPTRDPLEKLPFTYIISAKVVSEFQRHAIILCTDVNACRKRHLCLQTNHRMAASVESRAPTVSISVGLRDGPLEPNLDLPLHKLCSTRQVSHVPGSTWLYPFGRCEANHWIVLGGCRCNSARHGRSKINETISSSTFRFRPTLLSGSATARKS